TVASGSAIRFANQKTFSRLEAIPAGLPSSKPPNASILAGAWRFSSRKYSRNHSRCSSMSPRFAISMFPERVEFPPVVRDLGEHALLEASPSGSDQGVSVGRQQATEVLELVARKILVDVVAAVLRRLALNLLQPSLSQERLHRPEDGQIHALQIGDIRVDRLEATLDAETMQGDA